MSLVLFFVVAVLYSAVGHGGASGYLAVLTLVIGLSEDARPVSWMLNILVATIGTAQFASMMLIPWRRLLPFALGSVPLAFVSGSIKLTDTTYKYFVGVVLLAAAVRLLLGLPRSGSIRPTSDFLAVVVGAVIGLLSGLTGTGGGIFLTPLLLFAGWAPPKQAAGLSVAFILVNSIAALAGRVSTTPIVLPSEVLGWAVAAGVGGMLGSWYGARRSGLITLRRLLAVVLLIAAGKLLMGG